jgi:outer membrane protein TolC
VATLKQIVDASVVLKAAGDRLGVVRSARDVAQSRVAQAQAQLSQAQSDVQTVRAEVDAAKAALLALLNEPET